MLTLKNYMNRESTLNNKYSDKEKNKMIVPRMVPPPNTNNDVIGIKKSNQITDKPQPQRNPIRHYRKQLTGNNNPNILINPLLDTPGNNITKISNNTCPTCVEEKSLFFGNEIYPNSKDKQCLIDCTGYQSTDPTLWKYSCCTKENNVTKSASTNLSKKYSNSTRDYLKKKGKTFNNNLYSNITQVSRDCSNCNIDNKLNKGIANVTYTGNINNQIGGTSMSAYIYKRSFRDIHENSISNSNYMCCEVKPGKELYKNINNNCKVNDYPNLSRKIILCNTR